MRSPVFLFLLSLGTTTLGQGLPGKPENEAAMMSTFERQLAMTKGGSETVETHSRRGDLHLFLNQPQKAVTEFEKMIALDPTQDAPHWRLGIAYYFAGDFAKSARQFEKYHPYDGRDRENGIWKFLAQAQLEGIEKARREMLVYTEFDREPFPALYEMLAGKRSGADVLAEVERKKLTGDARVMFFTHYYVALNEQLQENRDGALEHLRKAVALFTPETAGRGGPGYMWQVARVHLARLKSSSGEKAPGSGEAAKPARCP